MVANFVFLSPLSMNLDLDRLIAPLAWAKSNI